jgi:hypothetical protein
MTLKVPLIIHHNIYDSRIQIPIKYAYKPIYFTQIRKKCKILLTSLRQDISQYTQNLLHSYEKKAVANAKRSIGNENRSLFG